MKNKRNSLSRKDGWKRFYNGIIKLRADIRNGATTVDTFNVDDYFVTHYGREDLRPLIASEKEPDERACSMFMYFFNRFRNTPRRKIKKVKVIDRRIDLVELTDENCIAYLKMKGYRIIKEM